MQGFMAQFARNIKMATVIKYWKPQDRMFDANNKRNQPTAKGKQHTANPNTIAKAIFNTFRSLC